MRGWISLVLCVLALATQAPSRAPTSAPSAPPKPNTTFAIPSLPISKEGAAYPDCRAEIIFVLDVSGSVDPADQLIMMRFVVQFMARVEAEVGDVRFGVVLFGIRGPTELNGNVVKRFDGRDFGGGTKIIGDGPFGDGLSTSTELFLRLDHLKYNCTECLAVNSTWSQLEMMYSVVINGHLTPTWNGLEFAKEEYEARGDPAVPGRFIVLITDGVPNEGGCPSWGSAGCNASVFRANNSVIEAKNGTLLLTVGVGPQPANTLALSQLLYDWASQPRSILAVPTTDYSKLNELIDKILSVMCPAGVGIDCLAEDAKSLEIAGAPGVTFLDTEALQCRFFRDNEEPTAERTTRAIWRNASLIACPIPTGDSWFPGTWNVNYTQDGRGYYKGPRFKTGTLCRPELLVIWWPFCALALLPLAFCRSKKVAPVTTTKVSRGVARPAPAATEEYEEYEEVEEIVAPPEPVNKWKVAPTAYIGFGRARMSVDWAGVAPESAPHEGVRKKVVKKVVSDHAPVPTAGPAFVPTPAPQESQTETVTQSRPQTVEEPDWVNSFMDRIAAIFCCCCVKKK